MEKNQKYHWSKKFFSVLLSLVMAASLLPVQPAAGAELSEAASAQPFLPKAGSIPVDEAHVTYDEPFAQWTAGSQYFRIPALITLQDGTLLATADARWETYGDGGGLDSIASISEDGGKTWQYSFPLFFPDSEGYAGRDATTIIDPGVMEGPDGTIYFIADVNPTGSTTMYKTIGTGTGYVTVDNGVDSGRYHALTEEYANVETEPSDSDLEKYPYYIADLDADGFAKIKRRDDGSETGYGVDEWYNLYTIENGEYINNLTQKQVNGEKKDIQQNAFFRDSKYHVYSIDYLWVITSKDGGRTWEHPRDLTDEIKRPTGENGLLVSPGQGITTSIGDIVIGFYNTQDGEENSSLVYSTDNGKTWGRTEDVTGASAGGLWSSENEVVELWDGTLRMFLRNGRGRICYADAVKKEDGTYEFESPVITDIPSITTGNGCNISAISYSKAVNGKQLLLVTTPTGGSRANGKIFAFLVESDNSITLLNTFDIPGAESGYVYSCLTEMEDGTIALLWEPNKWETTQVSMLFDTFDLLEIAPGAAISGAAVNVKIERGETYTRTYAHDGEFSVTKEADGSIAEVERTSLDGEKTITVEGTGAGYTEAIIDDVLYKIMVTDRTTYLELDEIYTIEDVKTPPENIDNGPLLVRSEEMDVAALFDHISDTPGSMSSFSSESNSGVSLSDAEFTLTGSGETWQVYNESKRLYLKNNSAAAFFESGAGNMKITSHDGGFRICQTSGQRYIIFFFSGMNFNTNTNYTANYADGSYEMLLLEKQPSISADDVLPGYRQVSDITSGRKYLIAYNYEGNIIVLYPENGLANQTKLVRKSYRVTVEAVEPGELNLTVDGSVYLFRSTDACSHLHTKTAGEIPAGCLSEGYTGDTYCADCGRFLEEGSAIPAVGNHEWDEGQITKEVTETENGEKVYTCKYDPFHKKTEVIFAHAYASVKAEYDAAVSLLEESSEFYQAEGIEKLKSVCEEYQSVMEEKYVTSGVAKDALTAFAGAMSQLEQKTDEELMENLTDLLADVRADYQAGGDGVSAAVWSDFSSAYEAAEDVTADAGFEELGNRIRALKRAYGAYVKEKEEAAAAAELAAAREILSKAVEAARKIYDAGERAYTPDTWKTFAEKYRNALNPPADAAALTLRRLATELQNAQNALVKAQQPTPEPEPSIQKGSVRVVNKITYQVTNLSAKKVMVTGASSATVKIPANVKIDNVSYAVTEIGAKAFSGSKTLKNVVIGDNVTSIGTQAFSGCKKLASVTIGKKVKTVSKRAFYNCSGLKKIILNSKVIKTHTTAFKKTYSKMTVKMPKGLTKSKKKKLFSQLQKAGVSKKAKMQ